MENPRGTEQGGGPPWLRATPDAANPVAPETGGSGGRGGGRGGSGGGPPWRQEETGSPPAADGAHGDSGVQGPTIIVRGEVANNDGNMLTVLNSEGALEEAMLGPPWFWSENGIPFEPGDQIELEGFQSPDHMEVNWIVNQTTGQSAQLRTADGAPVWGG